MTSILGYMKNNLPTPKYVRRFLALLLGLLLGAVYLVFSPYTIELVDYPKLLTLLLIAVVFPFFYSAATLNKKKVQMVRSFVDLPLILLIVSVGLSTWFSVDRIGSILPYLEGWSWSLPAVLSLAIVYYTMVTVISDVGSTLLFRRILLLVGGVYAALSLTNFLILDLSGLLSGQWGQVLSQLQGNLAGGPKSLIIFLVSLMPLLIYRFIEIKGSRHWLKPFRLAILSGVGLLLVGASFAAFNSYLKSKTDLPTELDYQSSWFISSSALREHPLFGTGPGTFTYNYASYKPLSWNLGEKWQLVFDKPISEYFNLLSALGLLGICAGWVLLYRMLRLGLRREGGGARYPFRKLYLASLLIILIGWVFVPANVVTALSFFIYLALWVGDEEISGSGMAEKVSLVLSAVREKYFSNNKGNGGSISAVRFSSSLIYILVLAKLLMGVAGVYLISREYRSNVLLVQSFRQASLVDSYHIQQEAINLNPYRDVYRRIYSQTNLLLAQAVAQGKGELSDQERSQISDLLKQSIRNIRLATERLSPQRAIDWEARGNIYSSLLRDADGAGQWAAQAYVKAISLEPTNPRHYFNLAVLYHTFGQYPLASQYFQEAVRVKPDWANAHFNLAISLRDERRFEQSDQEFRYAEMLLGEPIDERDAQLLDQERSKLAELFSRFSELVQREATGSIQRTRGASNSRSATSSALPR